jgi:pimeloyl-ACP methyl ester carboxylesterase
VRLAFPSVELGFEVFAHFVSEPVDRPAAAPLLVWLGGAIGPEEYERRRRSTPEALLAEVETARRRCGAAPLDLLVLSNPPVLLEPEDRLDRFLRFFVGELLPRLPTPPPTAIGLVGNSFGAHLGTALACRMPAVRALATIAGVGLWPAIERSGGSVPPRLALRVYVNDADFARAHADELRRELAIRGHDLDLVVRSGDHPFADYAANGSAADALGFVMEVLCRPGSSEPSE